MGIFGSKARDEWGNFSDKERNQYRENGTVHARLLAKGFTEADIQAELASEAGGREVFLAQIESDGDNLILGIGYTGDYRYEEEAAPVNLAKRLREHPQAQTLVKLIDEKTSTPVYVFNTSDRNWDFAGQSVRNAETAVSRHLTPYVNVSSKVWTMSVAEMREAIKGKVSPMPRKRRELEIAFTEVLNGKPLPRTANVGENHNGEALAIATSSPIQLALLEMLMESAADNALALGSSANPFSRGYVIFDVREVAPATVKARRDHAKWNAKQMAEVESTRTALAKSGSVYYIGLPREDDERGIIFFINYSPRGHSQIFGWFNKEQLQRIADGDFSDVKKD
jgi:hypothetical protein